MSGDGLCPIITVAGDDSSVIREVAGTGGSVVTALEGNRYRVSLVKGNPRIGTEVIGPGCHMEGRTVDGGNLGFFRFGISTIFRRIKLLGCRQSEPLPHFFLAEGIGPVHAGMVACAGDGDIVVAVGLDLAELVHVVGHYGEVLVEIILACLGVGPGTRVICHREALGMIRLRLNDGKVVGACTVCGHRDRGSGACRSAGNGILARAVNGNRACERSAVHAGNLDLGDFAAGLELEHQQGVHVLEAHAVAFRIDLCHGDVACGEGACLLGGNCHVHSGAVK